MVCLKIGKRYGFKQWQGWMNVRVVFHNSWTLGDGKIIGPKRNLLNLLFPSLPFIWVKNWTWFSKPIVPFSYCYDTSILYILLKLSIALFSDWCDISQRRLKSNSCRGIWNKAQWKLYCPIDIFCFLTGSHSLWHPHQILGDVGLNHSRGIISWLHCFMLSYHGRIFDNLILSLLLNYVSSGGVIIGGCYSRRFSFNNKVT